jgi:Ca2+-binding RTX toxin-like protein
MTQVTLTDAEIGAALLSPFKLAPAQFTFSVAVAGSGWTHYAAGTQPYNGYDILSVAQAAAFRAAMAAWDSFILADFVEVAETASDHGEIRAAFTSHDMSANTGGYAFQGNNQTPTSVVGDIWINTSLAGQSFDQGTDNYNILLHEVGHALGLKHPFEAPVIPAPYDNQRYTVLSYTTASPYFAVGFNIGSGSISTSSTRAIVTTPMVLDIAAAQLLYGAETDTAAGDDVYTYVQGDTTIQSLYDAGGTDTIDVSSFTRNNVIDLRAGGYSSIGLWTEAEQTAHYQAQTPHASFDNFIAQQYANNDAYEWRDNLGIALSTVIENAKAGSGNDIITGNDAANRLEGAGGNDTLDGGAGIDTLIGGAGDDVYYTDHRYDTVTESVDGGIDEVRTTAVDNTLPDNVEKVVLLGASGGVPQALRGNASDNVVTGSAGADGITLEQGGDDTVDAGGGDDGIFFGGALTAADIVDGGAGEGDAVALQGSYALTLGAGNLINVETLALLSQTGPAGQPYSYDLTTVDANVGAGKELTVNFNGLASGENVTFNGSAETDGSFLIYSGLGVEMLTGGQGSDGFYFGSGGRFDVTNQVIGGAGADDQLGLRGNYESIIFTATTMTGIETLALISSAEVRFPGGSGSFNYGIVLHDANVASGSTLTIQANSLLASEAAYVDGSQENDGAFRFFGGQGADTFIGGDGGDMLYGNLGGDVLLGGLGDDSFVYRAIGESTAAAYDVLDDFRAGDIIDISRIDANSTTGGNQAFAVIGGAAFSGTAGELRFESFAGDAYWVMADIDGVNGADLQFVVTLAPGYTLTVADFIV